MPMSSCCSRAAEPLWASNRVPSWRLGIFRLIQLHFHANATLSALEGVQFGQRGWASDQHVMIPMSDCAPSLTFAPRQQGKHWSENSSICCGQRWLAGKIWWQKHPLWVSHLDPCLHQALALPPSRWPCLHDISFLRALPRDLLKRDANASPFLQPAWSQGMAQPRPLSCPVPSPSFPPHPANSLAGFLTTCTDMFFTLEGGQGQVLAFCKAKAAPSPTSRSPWPMRTMYWSRVCGRHNLEGSKEQPRKIQERLSLKSESLYGMSHYTVHAKHLTNIHTLVPSHIIIQYFQA